MNAIFGRVLALLFCVAVAGGAQAQSSDQKHPFSVDDALRRSEVEAAALSPDGTLVAVQVTRPLTDPGVHAGARRAEVQPRGNIWLFDANLSNPDKLPDENLWVWGPAFSPSGRKLAALCSDPDGRVGLIVWDLATRSFARWSNVEVDVHAVFGAHGVPSPAIIGWGLLTRPFLWLDDRRILLVDRNGVLQQYGLAQATASATFGPLRARTKAGQVSVRVWNEKSPTEGVANRLVTLDVTTGATVVHYEGDVRAASLSPNGAQAALLVATKELDPTGDAMEPSLGTVHLFDDKVALSLVLKDLNSKRPAKVIDKVRLAGQVARGRLPLWTDKGRHVTLAGRASYSGRAASGDDFAWDVDARTFEATKVPARSALDADLLANLMAGGSGDWIGRRPSVDLKNNLLPVGSLPGGVWRFADNNYLIWHEGKVQIMTKRGVTSLPGEVAAVIPVATGKVSRFLLFKGEQQFDLHFVDGSPVLTEIKKPPSAELLAAGGARGMTLYKLDGESGTSLHLIDANNRTRSAVPFNQHMGAVIQPTVRELHLEIDGRKLTATLLLPPNRRESDRHPVIVTAYPGYMPAKTDSVHRLNSGYSSLYYPFQYLAGRGFAVLFVPFPVDKPGHSGPLQMGVDAVMPWLAVLDQQPEVLKGEYGYWGHSNAGYVGLGLEAKTNAFKAIAVSSTFPDLHWPLSAGLEFTALESAGEIIQARRAVYEYEAQPYTLRAPVWRAEKEWISNSPVFNLEHATTPLLLLEGEFDFGTPRPMEQVYSVLRGRGVPVELAQYWGESHIISSPGNLLDTWLRSERFFRKYLRMEWVPPVAQVEAQTAGRDPPAR